MKQLKQDLWTDGEHEYTGDPKQGFKKIKPKAKAEPVIEVSAFDLKQPKKEVDNEDKE